MTHGTVDYTLEPKYILLGRKCVREERLVGANAKTSIGRKGDFLEFFLLTNRNGEMSFDWASRLCIKILNIL